MDGDRRLPRPLVWQPNPYLSMAANWVAYRDAARRAGVMPTAQAFAEHWWPPSAFAPIAAETAAASGTTVRRVASWPTQACPRAARNATAAGEGR